MSVSILHTFLFVLSCMCLHYSYKLSCNCVLHAAVICSACIVATRKVVPVPSLQLSAVVQPLMLLQMVSEVALVQPLDP